MSLTLFEVLQNAEHNLKQKNAFHYSVAQEQLSNVIKQIEETDNFELMQDFKESTKDNLQDRDNDDN